MAKSSVKVNKSLKKTPADVKKLGDALVLVEAFVANISDVWPQMSQAQRQQVLDHSPNLSRIAVIARIFN